MKCWKSSVDGAGRNRSRLRSALFECSCVNFFFVECRQIDLVRTDWEKMATPLFEGTLVVATAARCKHRDGPRWPILSTFCPLRWRRITRRCRGGCADREATWWIDRDVLTPCARQPTSHTCDDVVSASSRWLLGLLRLPHLPWWRPNGVSSFVAVILCSLWNTAGCTQWAPSPLYLNYVTIMEVAKWGSWGF